MKAWAFLIIGEEHAPELPLKVYAYGPRPKWLGPYTIIDEYTKLLDIDTDKFY